MCGIAGVVVPNGTSQEVIGKKRATVKELNHVLYHRGPDGKDIAVVNGEKIPSSSTILGHTRLSIIDLSGGHQPIKDTNSSLQVIVNGEIYNHRALRETVLPGTIFASNSDSEIVLHLYKAHGPKSFGMLDGIFAAALSDGDFTVLARDPLGIKPLYVGIDESESLWFSSEVKGIVKQCKIFKAFPPGCYWESNYTESDKANDGADMNIEIIKLGSRTLNCRRYYSPTWWSSEMLLQKPDSQRLYDALENAVKKRMMADVPVAVFLSGGLDSSTVAALAKRHLPSTQPILHSFSVGVGSVEDSPDLKAARIAAKALGTEHHELIFSPEEGFKALKDVVYYLESYDPSPIRSGVAMYLLCGMVAKFAKVCLCGEAADEVFAGYLYFNEAKDKKMLHNETIQKIKDLHGVQLQFQDRLGMAQSLEIRVPFLDKELLEVALNVDPEVKMHIDSNGEGRIEKHYLRNAIEMHGNNLLPKNILWRRKEQFGDGVGYSWIDNVQKMCENAVSDAEFANASKLFPEDTPVTKEQFYYRQIFEDHFPGKCAQQNVNRWFPWSKKDNTVDASARSYAKDTHKKNFGTKAHVYK